MSEWRAVPGFPGYEVSSNGQVRSWLRRGGGRLAAPAPKALNADKDGYLYVHLYNNGRCAKRLVHRLVLEAFVGPCPNGHEARHVLSNDVSDNRLENLAWGTKSANMQDKRRHGTMPQASSHWTAKSPGAVRRGERCTQAKLTAADVIAIRASSAPSHALAERLGVSSSAVRKARSGINWSHANATRNTQ